jgi:hypothetical protein
MTELFTLSPRYRLDDELPWLEGIDPSRHYWIRVNGERKITVEPLGAFGAFCFPKSGSQVQPGKDKPELSSHI